MPLPRITLYSAGNCPHCRRVRRYLQDKGLHFQEFDVERSARAQRTLARLGARGVPVVLIGDIRIDGFDPRRMDTAIRRGGNA